MYTVDSSGLNISRKLVVKRLPHPLYCFVFLYKTALEGCLILNNRKIYTVRE